jgi:hypothetical protein
LPFHIVIEQQPERETPRMTRPELGDEYAVTEPPRAPSEGARREKNRYRMEVVAFFLGIVGLLVNAWATMNSTRPWLIVKDWPASFESASGTFTLHLANVGNAPALDVSYKMGSFTGPGADPSELDTGAPYVRFSLAPGMKAVIGPDDPLPLEALVPTEIFSPEQRAALASGALAQYVFGVVTYRDAYRFRAHTTRFCAVYRKGTVSSPMPCSRHNSAS